MPLIGDELQRNRIAARFQAICAAKYVRDDNVPRQIEQVTHAKLPISLILIFILVL